MRCLWIFALLVATTGSIAGCGGSGNETSPSNGGSNSQEATDQNLNRAGEESSGDQASKSLTPAAVVSAFLEAARSGNDAQVALLLTPTARTEVARVGLNVAPPASDTARFEVLETRKVGEKVAHVDSRWIEQPTPSAEPQVAEMSWALRLTDEEGWRIGGMAMIAFEDEDPLLLDYEKPAEVMQQYKMLHEEIARRKAESEQPQQKTLLR